MARATDGCTDLSTNCTTNFHRTGSDTQTQPSFTEASTVKKPCTGGPGEGTESGYERGGWRRPLR